MYQRLRVFDLMPEEAAPLSGDVESFVDAWRQWHYLSQAIVEVGKSWGEPQADDSHSALVYWPGSGEFYSRGSAAHINGSFKIAPHFVEVARQSHDGMETAQLDYTGRTLAEVTAWVRTHAESLGGSAKQESIAAPDLPDHPVADGGTFEFHNGWLKVYNHYMTTIGLLERFAESLEVHDVSEPQLWPHHFDLACLCTIACDKSGDKTRTVGVGMTPPDSVEESGYWYVSPWSRESVGVMKPNELPIGRWEKRGDLPMAVLPVSSVWKVGESGDAPMMQACAIAEFIATAFNACMDHFEKEDSNG